MRAFEFVSFINFMEKKMSELLTLVLAAMIAGSAYGADAGVTAAKQAVQALSLIHI